MPERAIRNRSASPRPPVSPPACSQRPHAIEAPGETPRPAMRRQSIQKSICRGIVALTRVAEGRGRRGEQHEHRQVKVFGELMQMPRRVCLGGQDSIQSLARQRVDYTIIERTRRMHHPPQRMLHRHRPKQKLDLIALRNVTRHDRHLGPQRAKLLF